MDWLGPALVFYVTGACVLLGSRRLSKVAGLRIRDVAGLTRTIRTGVRDELEALRTGQSDETPAAAVLSALLTDEPTGQKLATVNEVLGDLDRDLDVQSDSARLIGRGALLSGTLACVLGLTLTVAGPSGPAWLPSATSFLLGLVGWMASLEIDRRAREQSELARVEWDKVALALGDRLTGGATAGTDHDATVGVRG